MGKKIVDDERFNDMSAAFKYLENEMSSQMVETYADVAKNGSHAFVTASGQSFVFHDTKGFADVLKTATNASISVRLNGAGKIAISFYDLNKEVN